MSVTKMNVMKRRILAHCGQDMELIPISRIGYRKVG